MVQLLLGQNLLPTMYLKVVFDRILDECAKYKFIYMKELYFQRYSAANLYQKSRYKLAKIKIVQFKIVFFSSSRSLINECEFMLLIL